MTVFRAQSSCGFFCLSKMIPFQEFNSGPTTDIQEVEVLSQVGC